MVMDTLKLSSPFQEPSQLLPASLSSLFKGVFFLF